jgi:lysophospholipase L1-like esterase
MIQAVALLLSASMAAAASPVLVIAEGDSLTYGQDTSSSRTLPPINGAGATRSVAPYPETLQRLIGPVYVVANHGFPGDRTTEGLVRWPATPAAAVVILMYGTNDCMNYGGHPAALSVSDFSGNLRMLVKRRAAKRAGIIIVAPPPLADPVAEKRCQPYRNAAKQVARGTSAGFYALPRTPGMWSDGVHLSADGYTRLAHGLAPLVRRIGTGT